MSEVTITIRRAYVTGTTTDEEFIRAMRRVVKEQGEDHIAPGAYWSADGAYCIIGKALYSIDSALCPRNNQMLAEELLMHVGCSPRVAMAAHVAQFANDAGMQWGDVLAVFRWGLENWRPGVDKGRFTHEAVYMHPQRTAESIFPTAVKPEKMIAAYLSQDAIFPVMTWGGSTVVHSGMPPASLLSKKEHALTA